MTNAEYTRLKGIEAEREAKVCRLNKAADAAAYRDFFQNPEIAGGIDEQQLQEDAEQPSASAPHMSHDMRRMATRPISYCNVCSHFAWHGARSKLTKPCEPFKRGNAYALQLLQCDVVPAKGAKVPLHMRKRN